MIINIFIINLKTSIDRKDSMIKKIKNLKNDDFDIFLESDLEFNPKNYNRVNFNFFDAVSSDEIQYQKIKISNHNKSSSLFSRSKSLRSTEIACFASHYALWKKCLDLDSPLIILEDDVSFNDNFIYAISEIYKSNFSYVRLMYLFDRKIKPLVQNPHFYISFSKLGGTQGYYITPDSSLKLINNAKSFIFPVDDYMDMFFIHNVLNIIYKPFCIKEDLSFSGNSTIQKKDKPRVNKFSREICRFYFFVIRKYLYLIKYKIFNN